MGAGSGEGPDGDPETPQDGGTLVIGIPEEPDNLLDVASTTRGAQDIIDQMFLSLTEIGPDLISWAPQLAQSWEHSDDSLTVTFRLFPDARWHDGVPVTAHDVLFTHELHINPRTGYAARSWKESITDVVVEDEHTVTFHFDRKYPYQVMDASVGVVLPKHLLEDTAPEDLASGKFAKDPVGSGPFRFVKWEAHQFVELAANDAFFGGRPHLDRVVFRVIPDKTSRVSDLEAESIDVMEDLPPGEIDRIGQSVDHLRVERFPGRTYTYIGWDSTNPLFASKRARRALTMAIDRRGILQAVCGGYGQPCLGPIPPILWAHNGELEPLPFDPGEARRLLAEEGWTDSDGDGWLDRDGRIFEFELKTNLENPIRMDASAMIQSQLEEIGVKVLQRNYEWTALWESVINQTYETAVLVGWSVGLKVDLKPVFHSASRTGGFNHTGYANPAVDELIDRALSMSSFEEARPLWYEAQERIVEDQPYTLLFIADKVFGVNERVRGTVPDPRNYYRNLEDWWIPAARQRQRAQA
jgi:peptide/nickel transport system substrate-binding protein